MAIDAIKEVEKLRARILLVDDEGALRAALTRILNSAGHDVVSAGDGEEALQIFRNSSFDAIISDITMPKLDGLGLLKCVREQDEDLPFILLTGTPTTDTAIGAVRYRATEYLAKPVAQKQLLETVAHAVRLNRLAQVRREALALYQQHKLAGSDESSRLGSSFDRALDALFMVYQPIVDWERRTVFGYEALVRSSETSLPHPRALFDAAEKLDRLVELGRVIRAKSGLPLLAADSNASLFVNLHTRDLLDDTLFDHASVLTSIAPRVVLEITERANLELVSDIQSRVQRLRSLGFRIAIDDIGAGYSGLNSFAILKPDVVKIDITLVRGIDVDPVKQKLVRALLQLCADLGIAVVSEGVETPQERDALLELGSKLFQGYLFARPGAAFPKPTY